MLGAFESAGCVSQLTKHNSLVLFFHLSDSLLSYTQLMQKILLPPLPSQRWNSFEPSITSLWCLYGVVRCNKHMRCVKHTDVLINPYSAIPQWPIICCVLSILHQLPHHIPVYMHRFDARCSYFHPQLLLLCDFTSYMLEDKSERIKTPQARYLCQCPIRTPTHFAWKPRLAGEGCEDGMSKKFLSLLKNTWSWKRQSFWYDSVFSLCSKRLSEFSYAASLVQLS